MVEWEEAGERGNYFSWILSEKTDLPQSKQSDVKKKHVCRLVKGERESCLSCRAAENPMAQVSQKSLEETKERKRSKTNLYGCHVVEHETNLRPYLGILSFLGAFNTTF